MNALYLSWKNLINRPLSLVLSLLLFALGIGLASLLLQLEVQFEEKFDKNLAGVDLVVGAKGSPLQLILSSLFQIDDPTGNVSLEEARPFLHPKHPLVEPGIPISLGDSYAGFRMVGTFPDYLDLYDGELAEGRVWEKSMEAVIGTEVVKQEQLKIGDQFFSSHGFVQDDNLIHSDGGRLTVVGILKPSGTVLDQLVLTAIPSIWEVHGQHEESTDSSNLSARFLASLPADMDQQRRALITASGEKEITCLLLKYKARNIQTLNLPRNINENTDMMSASPAYQINRLYNMMGVGEDSLRMLALVILIVSGVSVFITLYNSLKDRKYELALMRVSGASGSYLWMLIILEGVLVALMGAILGLLLGHISMHLMAQLLQDSYNYAFSAWRFMPKEWLLIGGALCIGILAAVIPAVQAYRTNISETLRK